MNNTENENKNKTNLNVIVYIFAIIGFVAVIGGIIVLVTSSLNKKGVDSSLNEETKTMSQDISEAIEQYSADGKEAVKTDDKNSETESLAKSVKQNEEGNGKEELDRKNGLDDSKPLIVFLGDSIYDANRNVKNGIPYLMAERCKADYINLAISGSCASIPLNADPDEKKWNYMDGVGVAKAIAGKIKPEALGECEAAKLIKKYKNDFAKTDIFVIEFGINDFLNDRLTNNSDMPESIDAYTGAMDSIIADLRSVAPEAAILIMYPNYCEFYSQDGSSIGNSYTLKNNMGYLLLDYANKIEGYSDWENGIYTYDTNIENGINMYSAGEYLEDGIHLTLKGREKYADMVGEMICRNILKTEEPLE